MYNNIILIIIISKLIFANLQNLIDVVKLALGALECYQPSIFCGDCHDNLKWIYSSIFKNWFLNSWKKRINLSNLIFFKMLDDYVGKVWHKRSQ